MKVKSLSHVRLFATPWTVAYQAPWSMGFSRQEYWSGLLFPCPGDLPNPGIEPRSPALQVNCLPAEPPENPPKNKAKCVRIKFDQQNSQKFTTTLIKCRAKKENKQKLNRFVLGPLNVRDKPVLLS